MSRQTKYHYRCDQCRRETLPLGCVASIPPTSNELPPGWVAVAMRGYAHETFTYCSNECVRAALKHTLPSRVW
jgi:hypothetical protein